MYDFKTITIGYVPTRRDTFPDPIHALKQRDPIRQRIDELANTFHVNLVNIDWLNDERLLVDNADIPSVVAHFREQKVDALFIALCNFGQEEVIAKLAKEIGKPVLLWGPRDPVPPTDLYLDRQTDTQCGLFAASRALTRYGVPFTYIENCHLDSPILQHDFEGFIRTVSVVKAMTGLRIGQISTRPRQFLSVMVNESQLLEQFGIEVVPFNEAQLLALVRNYLDNRPDEVDRMEADIRNKVNCNEVDDKVRCIAALELAVIDLAQTHDCRAIACECWDVLEQELGIRPCFAFGDLTDRGLPTACETDIHGAISSVMLTAAARGESSGFLADITMRHPDKDNVELLWHCGPFPSSISKTLKPPVVDCHGQWEIQGGDVTLLRFDADRGNYKLFVGEAKGTDGPATNGNYLWIETQDWVAWEKKLIYGPYIHHIAGIHGQYSDVLGEACRYLNGLEFDPAP